MDDYQNLRILYLGSANRDFFKKVCSLLKETWTFHTLKDGGLDKFLSERSKVVLIFDRDHKQKIEMVKKLFDTQTEGYSKSLIVVPAGKAPPLKLDESEEYLQEPLTEWQAVRAVSRLSGLLSAKMEIQRLESKLSLQNQELSELNKIGVALSAERDPDTLLEMILTKAREITTADAGSIYLVEKNSDIEPEEMNFWADKQLRFKLAHNDSINASYQEFVMPVEKKSMAGYTALTGKPLNIKDAYIIPRDSEFQHNRSFDERMGYRTKSVLCIPMLSHQGEMIGVLQLINRKKSWTVKLTEDKITQDQVIAFDKRGVELASSLASQAAVSIENMRLYEEIKRLFEGFILASVHAIEQRDPTTSGHSERVAELTVESAKILDKLDTGPFRNVTFSRDDIQQLQYASLLHDFGKIGVRERVLVKAKKLYPEQLEAIKFRFQFIRQAFELRFTKQKIKFLLEKNRKETRTYFKSLESDFQDSLKEFDTYLEFILQANEPRILAEGGLDKLVEISQIRLELDNLKTPLINDDEMHFLTIGRGSLSEEERKEIESHVTHTYNFLSRIPWASHLKSVPQIAYAHHEKLDGSGYPRALHAADIPLPSKIMAISDIYDALTAADRPYKKAVPYERALGILESEMKAGKLDSDLFKIFIDAEIYKLVFKNDINE